MGAGRVGGGRLALGESIGATGERSSSRPTMRAPHELQKWASSRLACAQRGQAMVLGTGAFFSFGESAGIGNGNGNGEGNGMAGAAGGMAGVGGSWAAFGKSTGASNASSNAFLKGG